MLRAATAICTLVVMLSALTASADPVLLNSVPRTTWDKPCKPVMILQTALAGMGCPVSYDNLMVASGAAFRMTWRPLNYNYPATYLYQQDPISTGAVAVGARVERKQFGTAEEAYDAAADSIDEGRPVIAWSDGEVDWQVVCGYDEAKQTVFRRTINTGAAPDERPAVCLKAPPGGYGSKGTYELWLIAYDRAAAPTALAWPYILASALRLAQWPDGDRLEGAFVCGECAYYSWATDLRSSTLHEQFPAAGRMSRAHAWQLEGARSAAARVLQAHVGLHPALGQAALMYQDEARCFAKVIETLCGGAGVSADEAAKVVEQRIRDAAVRETAADLVEQALVKDKAARAALTTVLRDLAPDLVPVE
ncbi:MAG: hypothetical protein KKI08_11215 [Armatimonadetes bacterium]|nr:hypothetical protein [Armatimonadota bacterium]